jgi:general secretion pathway protein G
MPAAVRLNDARPREPSNALVLLEWLWRYVAVPLLVEFALFAVVPKYARGPARAASARVAAARADIQNVTSALSAFNQDVGTYPTAAAGLDALVDPPGSAHGWNGPYLSWRPALDPWGQPFVYIPATASAPPGVISAGPDGVQGTADDVAPIQRSRRGRRQPLRGFASAAYSEE